MFMNDNFLDMGRFVTNIANLVYDQMWIKDERMSTKVTDSTGSPGFALINKATGQALRHAHEEMQQVGFQTLLLLSLVGSNRQIQHVSGLPFMFVWSTMKITYMCMRDGDLRVGF